MNFDRVIPRVVFIALLFHFSTTQASELPKEMVIARADNHLTHSLAEAVMREAYAKLGIAVRFVAAPSKRSLVMANSGEADAEVGRVLKALEDYPQLRAVRSTPIARVIGVAVTKFTPCVCNSWKDLRGLQVGIRRGEVYAEKGTSKMSVQPAISYNQLLNMLLLGRIDVAVGILSSVKVEINSAFRDSGFKIIEKPLVDIPLYHLVNKKHQALVPKLSSVLELMASTGEIEEIHQRTLQAIINKRKAGDTF